MRVFGGLEPKKPRHYANYYANFHKRFAEKSHYDRLKDQAPCSLHGAFFVNNENVEAYGC